MKRQLLLSTCMLLAGSLFAADSTPKDEVISAAKKLGSAGGYSWKQTVDMGPNAQFTPGPTEGKADKDGLLWLSTSFRDNTMEGIKKGEKVAVKTEEGWKTSEELGGGGGGGGNPGGFMARRLQTLKGLPEQIEDLAGKTKELKKDGDLYSGDLTEDGAKALLTTGFGRRGGGAPTPPTDAKGSVKFWIKDGQVAKYETKLSGKREFGGEVRDIDNTTTVEIKDIGKTKLDLPAEAVKKVADTKTP